MDVRWHPAVDADDALRAHVADVVGTDPGAVVVGRLCPRCGSSSHGRPWADHRAGRSGPLHVSLARSGPHLVTAVCDVPVGVDLESVSSVDRAWADLPVTWAAASPRERAGLWCGIEAVAKLTGEGLTLRRGEAHLDGGDPSYQTLLGAYDLHRLPAPPGYAAVAAVAARDLLPDLELKGRAGVEGRG